MDKFESGAEVMADSNDKSLETQKKRPPIQEKDHHAVCYGGVGFDELLAGVKGIRFFSCGEKY